ncbi:NUDIX domain-containing protein [Candidatus Peregrinibacteria bacterium]|nr:NUDIX domain-containing protein [Candidatus Peregrinibacteria bacterium]
MINEFSAGFIVFSQNNNQRTYLILHYPSGHFDFPKGHLESGEDELAAARRELFEETGIKKIKIYDKFTKSINYKFRRGENIVNKTVTFFLCSTAEQKVKISHEHLDYLWLDYYKAIKKVTFDNARDILINAEKYLTENQHENKFQENNQQQ